ncbi:MAG: hypothetical protein K5695_03265 [Oscillospiraceae bacterium]|nr:hypothetical protein [Oscillospiraceae bacterium]
MNRLKKTAAFCLALAMASGMVVTANALEVPETENPMPYTEVYEPQTAWAAAATVAWRTDSNAVSVSENEQRPATGFVWLDAELKVYDRDGNQLSEKLNDYITATQGRMIPALYIKDAETAAALKDYLRESGLQDCFVVSTPENKELVQDVADLLHVRGMLDYTGTSEADQDALLEMAASVNAAHGKVALLNQSLATKENISLLQAHGVSVWAQTGSDTRTLVTLFLNGVGGILTDDYAAAIRAEEKFQSDVPSLLRQPGQAAVCTVDLGEDGTLMAADKSFRETLEAAEQPLAVMLRSGDYDGFKAVVDELDAWGKIASVTAGGEVLEKLYAEHPEIAVATSASGEDTAQRMGSLDRYNASYLPEEYNAETAAAARHRGLGVLGGEDSEAYLHGADATSLMQPDAIVEISASDVTAANDSDIPKPEGKKLNGETQTLDNAELVQLEQYDDNGARRLMIWRYKTTLTVGEESKGEYYVYSAPFEVNKADDWQFAGFSYDTDESGDPMNVKAKFVSAGNGDVSTTVNADRTERERHDPTCTEGGSVTWGGIVSGDRSLDHQQHEDVLLTRNMDAHGHEYETKYTWFDDNKQVTAEHKCKHCGEGECETVNTFSKIIKRATATEDGSKYLIAQFENEELFQEQSIIVTIPAKGSTATPPDRNTYSTGRGGTTSQTGSKTNSKTGAAADTGDKSPLGLWFGMGAVSLLGMGLTVRRKKMEK